MTEHAHTVVLHDPYLVCLVYTYIRCVGLKWESLWIQIFNFTLRFKQEKTQHYEKSMNFRNRQD